MYAFGLYDTPTFAFVLAWPLVETLASTVAGARVYRGRIAHPAAAHVRSA